jgi:hypothetical protein
MEFSMFHDFKLMINMINKNSTKNSSRNIRNSKQVVSLKQLAHVPKG